MAQAGLTVRRTFRADAKAGHSEPTIRFRRGGRLTDKSYPRDNRLVSPKSSNRRRCSAPRCRLILSWGWRRSQGFGCSPIKKVRELGSDRRALNYVECSTNLNPPDITDITKSRFISSFKIYQTNLRRRSVAIRYVQSTYIGEILNAKGVGQYRGNPPQNIVGGRYSPFRVVMREKPTAHCARPKKRKTGWSLSTAGVDS